MTTKEKVEAARAESIVHFYDRIADMKAALQDMENIGYAMKKGRIDGLDHRIQDIIDDPNSDRIRAFATEFSDSIKLGLL